MRPEVEVVRAKFLVLQPLLDERQLRWWAATEARALGRGGLTVVSAATGLSTPTLRSGLKEIAAPPPPPPPPERGSWGGARKKGQHSVPVRRIRAAGGGRKKLTDTDPSLAADLDALIAPETRGDPMSPLRWTCKSTRQLAEALRDQGHTISHQKVAELLTASGYSLQAPRKTREGSEHPDRNAQFLHLNQTVQAFQAAQEPVISVDTKKKELVGDYDNGGQEWQRQGQPEEVRVHDFPDRGMKKAVPYGVYDPQANRALVTVGTDHDTPTFAVSAIRHWWQTMGSPRYPQATKLLITADGGGSNSRMSHQWKHELQGLANETGLTIHVCHFPPGTSKWNQIEHRLFSHITQNWRGRPLLDYETVVSLIANTTTRTGLRVEAVLDRREYPTKQTPSLAERAALNLSRDAFHGEWNYAIAPNGAR